MVGTLLPGLSAEATQLAEELASYLDALGGPLVTVHGDFYEDQIFVSDAGVVLLDFEEARLGNPLLDVGHFLAQLSLRGNAEEARTTFLDTYTALRPEAREHTLLFEAAAILGLAIGPFQRLRPAWPDKIERRVRLAARRLDEYRWTRNIQSISAP